MEKLEICLGCRNLPIFDDECVTPVTKEKFLTIRNFFNENIGFDKNGKLYMPICALELYEESE